LESQILGMRPSLEHTSERLSGIAYKYDPTCYMQLIRMARVKITVLKTLDPKVMFGDRVPINPRTGKRWEVCSKLREGQEFIVEETGGGPQMPSGFCSWAWNDIFKEVVVLKFGGNITWMDEGKAIACCTDGIRPVSFELERLR